MSNFKPIARKSDIVVQDFDNEVLIYDLRTNRAFALNETSALVWQYCDGKSLAIEIADRMSVTLNQIVTEDMVWFSIEELKKENLIDNASDEPSRFDGLSRREVVRKIGFASMIALPIISSLVAPNAVFAASCAGPGVPGNIVGCPCNANANCTSSCCATTPTGNTCVMTPGIEPPGSGCRGNCECSSNACPPAPVGSPRVCV